MKQLSIFESTAEKLKISLEGSRHLKSSTLAMMLTYGDRVEYVAQSAAAALATGCANVIIVSNGCPPVPLRKLVDLTNQDSRIILLSLDMNYGSAGGIFYCLESTYRAGWSGDVLLLDDDNVLEGNGLLGLRECRTKSANSLGKQIGDVIVCASRPCISHFREAARSRLFPNPPAGSFLTFDIATKFRKLGAGDSRLNASSGDMPISMQTAPYGGLLLSAQALRSGIRPDPALILYEDDTEFTNRLSENGFFLVMCEDVAITDLDVKWSDHAGVLPSALVVDSPARCFFGVRNRLNFETSRCSTVGDRVRFVSNGVVFVSLAILKAVVERSFKGWSPFFAAIRAGLRRSVGNSDWGMSLGLRELPEHWLVPPSLYSQGVEIQIASR